MKEINTYINEKLHLNKDIELNEKEMMLIMYKGEGSSFDKVFYKYSDNLSDSYFKTFAGLHDVISAYIGSENDLKELENLNREKKFKEIPGKVKELGIKIKFQYD